MQPTVLTILVIAPNHAGKTVLNPGKGTWIKGKDKDLPAWLVASVEAVKELHPGSVVDVVQRWHDRNDKMLPEQVDW